MNPIVYALLLSALLFPWSPRPGDENLIRGEVYYLTIDYPNVVGYLPTPCHRLRITEDLEVYSLAEPEVNCMQTLMPFFVNLEQSPVQAWATVPEINTASCTSAVVTWASPSDIPNYGFLHIGDGAIQNSFELQYDGERNGVKHWLVNYDTLLAGSYYAYAEIWAESAKQYLTEPITISCYEVRLPQIRK